MARRRNAARHDKGAAQRVRYLWDRTLGGADQFGHEVADRRRRERGLIGEYFLDRLGLFGAEVRSHAGLELLDQHRHAFDAPFAMPDRIVHLDSRATGPILEENLNRIADVA